MEASSNRFIRVAYELISHRNGVVEEVEKTTREKPFQFISGIGYTLEAFEKQLVELKKGDTFDFTIPSAEGYGEYDAEHVQTFERDVFTIDGKFDSAHIFDGNVVEMMRSDGSPILGTVLEVTPLKVVIDFNHPLADSDLQFVGTIIESRQATNEEVKKLIESLSPSGCGCGGCGGGCDDGCNTGGCGSCESH